MRIRSPRPLRLIATATAVLGATALLAGCTASSGAHASSSASAAAPASSAAPSAAATPSASTAALACAPSGSASDAIKVTGASGAQPKVTFPTPTAVTSLQRTVLSAGSGPKAAAKQSVQIAYSVYEGKTGKLLDSSGYGTKAPVVLALDTTQYVPGLVEALACGQKGSRIASAIPAADAFGSQGSEQLGVGAGDSIVFVADIRSIVPDKASGTAKALPAGFPKVVLASSGQPTVTIPATAQPKTLRIADREVGHGDTVKSGDTVTVQYQGVIWRTGKVFDQSWGRGATSFSTSGVVPGFSKALVGQKVGSQVVTVIPPAEGYKSAGQPSAGIKGTDDLVFVIDILATTHATAG